MKQICLLVLLTVCCFLFTGCYTDPDPWPVAESQPVTAPPAVTQTPGSIIPSVLPNTSFPPEATQEPLPPDAVDHSSNFNG